MKKLRKISLQSLIQNEMIAREQNMLKGGSCSCSCTCEYYKPESDDMYGGSAFVDNLDANDFLSVRP